MLHDSEEVLTQAFETLLSGDAAQFLKVCAYDLTVIVHGSAVVPERCTPEHFAERYVLAARSSRTSERYELQNVLSSIEGGVVIVRQIERRGGLAWEHDLIHRCEIIDGTLTSLNVYPTSLTAACETNGVSTRAVH